MIVPISLPLIEKMSCTGFVAVNDWIQVEKAKFVCGATAIVWLQIFSSVEEVPFISIILPVPELWSVQFENPAFQEGGLFPIKYSPVDIFCGAKL